MKKLTLDGIVGWDITPTKVKQMLDEANGEALEIDINSPGGFVFDGITIFNYINEYAQKYKNVTMRNIGLAASMGSILMLAGNKAVAFDNASYMIHNAQSFAIGDHRAMQKEAQELEAVTNLLAKIYVKKTGKSLKKIREMMDDETWTYGDEQKNEGFVDEIIETIKDKSTSNKEENIIINKGRIKDCFSKMKESKNAESDIRKAASLIDLTEKINQSLEEKQVEKTIDIQPNKTEVKIKMTANEIKLNHPEIYNEIINIGREEIKTNINAHLEFSEIAPEDVLNSIKNFENFEVSHVAKYGAARLKKQSLINRETDNIGEINTPDEGNKTNMNDEADTEKAIAEYQKKFGGKK